MEYNYYREYIICGKGLGTGERFLGCASSAVLFSGKPCNQITALARSSDARRNVTVEPANQSDSIPSLPPSFPSLYSLLPLLRATPPSCNLKCYSSPYLEVLINNVHVSQPIVRRSPDDMFGFAAIMYQMQVVNSGDSLDAAASKTRLEQSQTTSAKPPQPSPSVSSQLWITSGDENHLCGASLHALPSQKIHSRIHHAHGIDYHHDHIGATGLVQWCL